MTNERTSRKTTTRILDMLDDGDIDARSLVETCLNWMSEADVTEMAEAEGLVSEDE